MNTVYAPTSHEHAVDFDRWTLHPLRRHLHRDGVHQFTFFQVMHALPKLIALHRKAHRKAHGR